jgi:hypothetical protein
LRGNAMTHRSGAALSPLDGVAPDCRSFVAEASDRASPKTSCPRAMISRTTAEPMTPVPPSTRTRKEITPPWKRAHSRAVHYCAAMQRSQNCPKANSGATTPFNFIVAARRSEPRASHALGM